VIRTVAKEDVEAVMKSCANVRDYFLMYLLFETGMRIGDDHVIIKLKLDKPSKYAGLS
jgi:hypothetical protein